MKKQKSKCPYKKAGGICVHYSTSIGKPKCAYKDKDKCPLLKNSKTLLLSEDL